MHSTLCADCFSEDNGQMMTHCGGSRISGRHGEKAPNEDQSAQHSVQWLFLRVIYMVVMLNYVADHLSFLASTPNSLLRGYCST